MSTPQPDPCVHDPSLDEARPLVEHPTQKAPRKNRESIERRMTSAGVRYYGRYIDVDGKRKHRLLSTTTRDDARAELARIRSRVLKGLRGVEEVTPEQLARKSITVAELFKKFHAEYSSPKLKNPTEYKAEAKSVYDVRIDPVLGEQPAAKVTALAVEKMRDKLLADEYAGASVVLTLALLSKMYTWGRKAGHVDCDNPVKGCDRPDTNESIDYLDKHESARLLAHVQEHARDLHPMIATALYTGMRKGELFGLRWIDVRLEQSAIDVMRSYKLAPKSGKPRHVPLHAELAPILRGWKKRCPRTAEGLVFPVDGNMGTSYDMLGIDELLTAAECHEPTDGKPWHMLRHTFASHFIMAGGNILTLQKLLGHSSLTMTMRYAHLAPDHLAAEVARMTFKVKVAGVDDVNEERRRRAAEEGHHEDTGDNADAAPAASV
jgi:integrase